MIVDNGGRVNKALFGTIDGLGTYARERTQHRGLLLHADDAQALALVRLHKRPNGAPDELHEAPAFQPEGLRPTASGVAVE